MRIKTKTVMGKLLFWCEPYEMWLTDEGCKRIRNKVKKKTQAFISDESFSTWSLKCKSCPLKDLDKLCVCSDCGGGFVPYVQGNVTMRNVCPECLGFRKRDGRIINAFRSVLKEYKEQFLNSSREKKYEDVIKDMFEVYYGKVQNLRVRN